MRSLHEGLGLAQIAIDGKTLRGSATDGRKAVHLVSAWATANALSLGQVATEEKSNEITAIPKLLELLELHGALATIDAMGCKKEIAAAVVDRGGDYVLTVKGNQPNLLEDVQECFTRASDVDFRGCDYDEWETDERGHGRTEKRSYTILRDPQGIRGVEARKGLCVVGMCVSEGLRDGKESHDVRYFIGSRRADAKTYGAALRNHWRIENSLHWQLDVSFGEDGNAVGGRRSAENLALVRRLALSLLKQRPEKRSIACNRLRAALETSFLEQVLCGDINSDKM